MARAKLKCDGEAFVMKGKPAHLDADGNAEGKIKIRHESQPDWRADGNTEGKIRIRHESQPDWRADGNAEGKIRIRHESQPIWLAIWYNSRQ